MVSYNEILMKSDLFSGLTLKELDTLIDYSSCEVATYPKDTLVVQETDRCERMSFILEGSMSIQQIQSSGESLTLKLLEKGESFGQALLFVENSIYKYSFLTLSETVLLHIPVGQVKRMLKESFTFNLNYIIFLSNRLEYVRNKIFILSQKDVRSRLLIYLKGQSKKKNSLAFRLENTRTEIAELIGVARPSISRELTKMEEDGLIKLNKKEITILKPEILIINEN
jgi:CRP-like cAMP-binding protein